MLDRRTRVAVERLVRTRVKPAVEAHDVWAVCTEITARLPDDLVRALASEYLADAYLDPRPDDRELNAELERVRPYWQGIERLCGLTVLAQPKVRLP